MSPESRSGSGQGSEPGSDVGALTRSPGFWRLMGYAALFGVVLAFAALAFLGLVNAGNFWFTLPDRPRMVRREPLVGGGDRGRRPARRRAAARPSRPARAAGHGPRAQGPARRALHGAGGGCCLAGVAGGWGEPRARRRIGEDGGRARNLGLGAAEARRGDARDEHAQWDVRGLRGPVVISDPGVGSHARDRASKGGTLRRHAGRRTAGGHGRLRGVLPDRGVDVRRALRDCRRSSTRTGSCSRPFPSASPPARSR